ncbi:hypothetical protein AQ505_12210 [Pedobacter sp. PACM 27299]|uniref:hypothetical protein n=1 Tax=Pedobacter sp. PACM 27299 TaxID=1727164 RepID=UPI00070633FA|nr:hypothetical protein [Pedobacter sp. PACM 27299]ALL06186.1 hypothetical protein AQ505_12210 [Pedobacter sp. PACM 27299]
MNSYHQNLHSAIVGSLQSLDIEEQNLKSQVNASMFTLYHAQGATITAEQNLAAAKDSFKFKSTTQSEAVKDSNVSINLLNCATQSNQYVKQSTTNIAVCAANVQISANAIVRLASDIGSIYSILNAADFDSDIYYLARDARELINETAYDAELASQLAMEASMLTAEVSAATVLDMAKATNNLMASVLKITTADFDLASQAIATDSAAVSAVRSTEKLDEGALEMVTIAYSATKSAYALTNRELNLDLLVTTSNTDALSFTVDFNTIKSPFPLEKLVKHPMYPVERYYLIVVKEKKKQTFSISNVERLMNSTELIPLAPTDQHHITQVVNVFSSLKESTDVVALVDSDNDPIGLGKSYVVFVMAVFSDEYKRTINCYDDYLSAPSQTFTLASRLESIPGEVIQVSAYDEKDLSDEERRLALAFKNEQLKQRLGEDTIVDYNYVMTFSSQKSADTELEYRCMLLPFSLDVSDQLLTKESLEFLVRDEIAKLEEIAAQLDPEIARLEEEVYTEALKLELLNKELDVLNQKLADYAKEKEPVDEQTAAIIQSLKEEQKLIGTQLKQLQDAHKGKIVQLDFLKEEKEKQTGLLSMVAPAKPGFLFNVPIAEQVYADSYTVAKQNIKAKDSDRLQWVAFFGPDTTDNFGNRLNEHEKYLPVILSYSRASADSETAFVNVLSDMANTDYFPH